MKLDIPFYPQNNSMSCGPAALRMAISYLDKDYGQEKFDELVGIKNGKGVLTISLAIAAKKMGFKTKFFSKSVSFDESHMDLEFYKEYIDEIERSKDLVKEAKSVGVEIKQREILLEELLSFLTKDSVVLILLDWNVVNGMEGRGYQGHLVPVVGYDAEFIYVHDQGTNNPKPNISIKREVFEKARKSRGTDEDIVVVYRK